MLRYDALITPEELLSASQRSSVSLDDLADSGSSLYAEAIEVIHDVTDDIEQFLNRKFIVRKHTLFLDASHWRLRYQSVQDEEVLIYYLRQRPGLQILEVDGVSQTPTNLEFRQEGSILAYLSTLAGTSEPPKSITLFSGYRRTGQSINSELPGECGTGGPPCQILTEEAGLSGLTVLPDRLPGDVRRVAVQLSLVTLRNEIRGLTGLDRVTRRIDNQVVESQAVDSDFRERRILSLMTAHGNF